MAKKKPIANQVNNVSGGSNAPKKRGQGSSSKYTANKKPAS